MGEGLLIFAEESMAKVMTCKALGSIFGQSTSAISADYANSC
jgi:hypothetical protein